MFEKQNSYKTDKRLFDNDHTKSINQQNVGILTIKMENFRIENKDNVTTVE